MSIYVPWSKVAILGMVIPPFNRNPYSGYINPYYWVDDHPLLYIYIYGNNGSLDPGTFESPAKFGTWRRDILKWDGPLSVLQWQHLGQTFLSGLVSQWWQPPHDPLKTTLVIRSFVRYSYEYVYIYMPGKDWKWTLKNMKWLSYRYTIQFPLFKAYLSGCRNPQLRFTDNTSYQRNGIVVWCFSYHARIYQVYITNLYLFWCHRMLSSPTAV